MAGSPEASWESHIGQCRLPPLLLGRLFFWHRIIISTKKGLKIQFVQIVFWASCRVVNIQSVSMLSGSPSHLYNSVIILQTNIKRCLCCLTAILCSDFLNGATCLIISFRRVVNVSQRWISDYLFDVLLSPPPLFCFWSVWLTDLGRGWVNGGIRGMTAAFEINYCSIRDEWMVRSLLWALT